MKSRSGFVPLLKERSVQTLRSTRICLSPIDM